MGSLISLAVGQSGHPLTTDRAETKHTEQKSRGQFILTLTQVKDLTQVRDIVSMFTCLMGEFLANTENEM